MKTVQIDLANGAKADISVAPASSGNGVVVVQKFPHTDSATVTCTCIDGNKTYTTTAQCASISGNTCDCSTPSSPRVTCG